MGQPCAAVKVPAQVVLHARHLPAPRYEGHVGHGCYSELARERQDPPAVRRAICFIQAMGCRPGPRSSPFPLPCHHRDSGCTGAGCSLHRLACKSAAADDDHLLPLQPCRCGERGDRVLHQTPCTRSAEPCGPASMRRPASPCHQPCPPACRCRGTPTMRAGSSPAACTVCRASHRPPTRSRR